MAAVVKPTSVPNRVRAAWVACGSLVTVSSAWARSSVSTREPVPLTMFAKLMVFWNIFSGAPFSLKL